ncbi:hypothetical protein [Aerosticca soli]|uniref:Uncharacterized protein n=1 Tax=Aerosticca soli TaxID=2010829 RepID=A0A2Z6E1N1_9GAMM|nr:hypothetical protein [Aerosticca soli]BBD78906.1 hypothetical protein ALSL_0234 [Aerosticca soli]
MAARPRSAAHPPAQVALQTTPAPTPALAGGYAEPLWQSAGGQSFSLTANQYDAGDAFERARQPLPLGVVGMGPATVTSLNYGLDNHLQLHAGVGRQQWIGSPLTLYSNDVGATYHGDGYSMDLSVSTTDAPRVPVLPRVLPGVPGVGGLSEFDGSTHFNAQGRFALDARSGIDLGASVGRIRLLPGNLLGTNVLDQKTVSFGVDHGPLSGAIVGRTLRPSIPGNGSIDRRWNSIDLGVTVRLPWQGEISIGAQNLWSSGSPANGPVGAEPDQSRTPYVQYHQDL